MGQRVRVVARRLLLGLLPALLLGLYANRPELAFLMYGVLVPWILLYTDDRRPKVSVGYYMVGAWIGWIALYPAGFRFGWFAPPAMSLFAATPWLPAAWLLRGIHHRFRMPRALSVPLVWVTLEWFRTLVTPGHFDIQHLAYSQARFPLLIQIADVVGHYAVSFLVAAANGLAADAWFAVRDAGGSWRGLRARRFLGTAGAVAAALVVTLGYGGWRLATFSSVPGPRLAVVQPNAHHGQNNAIGLHLAQVIQTYEDVPAGAADLIVWPENAILGDLSREPSYHQDLAWLAAEKNAWLLVGALDYLEEDPGRARNAAVLLDPWGRVRGRYGKQVLFAWSEYLPLGSLLEAVAPPAKRWIQFLTRLAWGYLPGGVPGDGMVLLPLSWEGQDIPFAALICVENTYPPVPAEAGRMGARFFVNITSEGTVAGPVQEQLLRVSMLRAVENRIAYVRAGNTGISGFIDPAGRLRAVLRGPRGRSVDEAGVLIERVPLSAGHTTLFARSRGAFVWACVALTLALWAASWFRRPRASGPRGR